MRKNIFVLSSLLFLLSCKEDSVTGTLPPDFSNDYFPFTRTYTWTYSTNALSDSGKSVSTFEMRIDTMTFENGVFWALLARRSGAEQWGWIAAIKDSGGIVYTLGDHPPETPYPLFKHSYLPAEGVRETISVSGTIYESVRIDHSIENGGTLSFWFAKGVGLIKESSNQGASLFSDDNSGDNIFIETTLTSVRK